MLLNCGVGEDSWESLGRKESKPVNPKGNQSWIFIGRTDAEAEAPVLWPLDMKSWLIRKDWCWQQLKAGGEGDDRGWDGWMASPTRWIWVWASSRYWWWTEKPGVLQSVGLQWVRHRATELTDRDSGKSWFKNQTIESKMKTTHWFQQLCGCLRLEENVQALRGKRVWLLTAQQHWELTFQE